MKDDPLPRWTNDKFILYLRKSREVREGFMSSVIIKEFASILLTGGERS